MTRGLPALALPALLAVTVGAVAADPPPEVLVSRQLAAAHGLQVGSTVRLSGHRSGTGARPFRVAGVYDPVPDPAKLGRQRLEVRLHLPDLQSMTADPSDPASAESVTAIHLALEEDAAFEPLARDVRSMAPGLYAFPAAEEDGAGMFVVLERFHTAIALVTVLGSTAFLLALMVMRAEERREAVGILRLVGVPKRRVLAEVTLEGLFVAVPGALFGVLFAMALQEVVNQWCQWRYDTNLVFLRVTAGIAWRCVILAVPLGVLAGLAASWSLLRREVLELIRR